MRKDRPSLTAQRVALSRAAHQLFDQPRLLEDPLAVRIIGPLRAEEIRAHRRRHDHPVARRLRAFLVARSRVAEDALAEAVSRGVHQYVVLGAGLDTFAYRSPYPASVLKVFEVDHPLTQAWKRRQLSAADAVIPRSLTFVTVDFEKEALADRLREAGFRTDEPSFFSWLGVVMYLTRESVLGTLKYLAGLPPGSGLVFDYAVAPARLTLVRRLAAHALLRRVASVGEPWKSFFEPMELSRELRALGFAYVQDLGPDELNARFFNGRTDQLRVAGLLGRVMSARV